MGTYKPWYYLLFVLSFLFLPAGDFVSASDSSLFPGASPLRAWLTEARDKEEALPEDVSGLLEVWQQRRLAARRKADSLGLPVRWEAGGRVKEIQFFKDGFPYYHVTHNLNAAITTSTNELWPINENPYALNGSGVLLGIWDGGRVMTNHQELVTRVRQRDGATTLSNHATHVGGTMMAAGLADQARGMAYSADLDAHDWNDDVAQMLIAAADGLRVSNHSYGYLAGWHWTGSVWRWYGHHEETEARGFGAYDQSSWEWDMLARLQPSYLIVKAAGNSRGQGPSNQPVIHEVLIDDEWVRDSTTVREKGGGDDGFDCLPYHSVAKNILTVGAIFPISGGYSEPADVQLAHFSSRGPTNDGRIKPDLVATGIGLYSASSDGTSYYSVMSGTSMAAPNVSGSIGLLLQLYNQTYGHDEIRSATMKSLLIHTADQAGVHPGPDYRHGWGVLNSRSAADVITRDANKGEEFLIRELTLHDSDTITLPLWASGEEPLKLTIAWTDPPGEPPPSSLNPPDLMLVNDLDMRISDSQGNTYKPYILDPGSPAAPATAGDNFRDNVEQVIVPEPEAGESFSLRITHKGELEDGLQDFSLIITGAAQASTFTGPGNDWSDPENWSHGLPKPGGNIIITSSPEPPVITEEVSVANIYIEKGGLLVLGQNSQLDVEGNIYSEDTTASGILIRSGAEGTGSLIHDNPGVPVTLQRYTGSKAKNTNHADTMGRGYVADMPSAGMQVPGRGKSRPEGPWHLLGTPVEGQSFEGFVDDNTLESENLFSWDESQGAWHALWDGTWQEEGFLPARGYLYAGVADSIMAVSGFAFVSDLLMNNLSLSPETGAGWHLLGNPYTAGLYWDEELWGLAGIAHTAKVWVDGGYIDLPSGEGIIPAMHGFLVQAIDQGNSLNIPKGARTHDSIVEPPADEQRLRIMAKATDYPARQQSMVRLTHKAEDGFDPRYDAGFLAGHGPIFYSSKEARPLSTMALPSEADNLRLRFYFKPREANQEHEIHLLENNIDVPFYLYDKHTGALHDLSEDRPYHFISSSAQDPWPRFELHITSSFIPTSVDDPAQQEKQHIWYHDRQIHYRLDDYPASIRVFTTDGRQAGSYDVTGATGSFPAPAGTGIYVVEVSGLTTHGVTRVIVH